MAGTEAHHKELAGRQVLDSYCLLIGLSFAQS
jgi:hypothetical protein